MKRFNNLSLSIKINIILILMLVFMLVTTLLILNNNIRAFTLQTGQQRLEQEINISQSRFAEAERDLLLATRLLATTPRLAASFEAEDALAARLSLLTNANTLGLDKIEVVDLQGNRVTALTSKGIVEDPATVQTLIALGVQGNEAAAIINDQTEAGAKALMAAVVPLENSTGETVGAILSERDIDDAFLTNINLAQDEVNLWTC